MIKKVFIVCCLLIIALPSLVLADCSCVCYNTADMKGGSAATIKKSEAECSNKCAEGNPGKQVYYTCESIDSTAGGSGLLPTPGDKIHAAVPSGLPTDTNVGNYQIKDLLELGKKVSNWILGMVGSAALLMFIWGGFQWLTSQGESAKVAEGKKIMTAAVIGLVIVFSSYIMIKFVVVDVLNMKWEGGYVTSK
jgi:hypothetical protein